MRNTLTVGDLKNMLSDYDDDLPVYFQYNYGDYWRTQVAGEINDIYESQVEYSGYHRMETVVDEPSDDTTPALILTSL